MAYADQQMSGNKITALIVVAILHVALGYALVTGLAYEAYKKVKEVTSAVNIEEEKPPELPPPPPPPKDAPPPPIVAPPPAITLPAPAPVLDTVQHAEPPEPPRPPVQLPPPPSPPPPRFTPKAATPKGNPGNWATSNDYPSRALREEREGSSGFRVSVGADGKVTSCEITRSSGSPDLDQATCDNVRRRARFTPATDGEGNPTTGSYASTIRWVIPKD
ncbi:MAG: energy transducer TonB [Novosphingobium sp.]|uniref:energy transducer TonB n=1 Tax=Novosphingobium sp. TaxID=1874826 RepID=UPI003017C8B0